eukprot:TRINITY_DN12069_c1_g3_i2.p2 TRINITY_DN12069_c1_g3~~TRINITY_DN12069_c1_g3_i2.p2  ORF type:complete len:279 (+),score=31.23 TRINITY_DN12069_c1_g3_i2:1230-2066(+)
MSKQSSSRGDDFPSLEAAYRQPQKARLKRQNAQISPSEEARSERSPSKAPSDTSVSSAESDDFLLSSEQFPMEQTQTKFYHPITAVADALHAENGVTVFLSNQFVAIFYELQPAPVTGQLPMIVPRIEWTVFTSNPRSHVNLRNFAITPPRAGRVRSRQLSGVSPVLSGHPGAARRPAPQHDLSAFVNDLLKTDKASNASKDRPAAAGRRRKATARSSLLRSVSAPALLADIQVRHDAAGYYLDYGQQGRPFESMQCEHVSLRNKPKNGDLYSENGSS